MRSTPAFAAAVIISLTLLGQLMELRARAKTSAAIKALLGLAPKTARRIDADGSEQCERVGASQILGSLGSGLLLGSGF